LFVLFVFSPIFFIFGFDYSFVRNTYPGPATRLGGFFGVVHPDLGNRTFVD